MKVLFLIEGELASDSPLSKLDHVGLSNFTFEKSLEYDFVCLLHAKTELNKDYLQIMEEYVEEKEKTIYLPLVVLINEEVKGVLNSCLWNQNLAQEIGILDYELAKRQVDTTLYGALIPTASFFNEKYYDEEIKYYEHFYFLNQYTKDEEHLVIGVPKTLLSTEVDLSLNHVDNEEKIKYFKLSREKNSQKEQELTAI